MYKELEVKNVVSSTKYENNEKINSIKNLNDLIKKYAIKSGFAICYIFGRIIFGKVEETSLIFNDDLTHLNELDSIRVFNEDVELLITKNAVGYSIKFIDDTKGYNVEYVDTSNVIFGTKINSVDNKNKFTQITEDRGIDIELPFLVNNINKRKRVKIVIRNYISYNKNQHAIFGDYRFVKFLEVNNE